ncbi:MAG: head-tail adaptor protein [Rhizobiales bacterium]|nr:head-tail adaptor protein [Hyphomicrobiales bacterium]MBN8983510.1 head-tail adaptor protein [Hyphomicrobiales bacterium]
MIDPGALKTRLTLEAPVETDDGQGGVTRGYATFAKVWAQVAPLGARPNVTADADGAAVRYRIVTRCGYVLTLQHRFVDGPRVYRILSFRERDGGRFIEIEAELRVE